MDKELYAELKAVIDQAYAESGEPALAAGLVVAYATMRAQAPKGDKEILHG